MGDDGDGCAPAVVLFLPEAVVVGVRDVGGGAASDERGAGGGGDTAGVLVVQAVVRAAEGGGVDAVSQSVAASDSL